jgi:undecaprenyl-diphosphatase
MPRLIVQKLMRAALNEIGAVVAMGVAALGVLLFALIADEALEGDTHAFDEAILLALREPGETSNPVGPWWLEYSFADITALGGYTVLTLLVAGVAIYLVSVGKRATAVLVIGAVASGTVVSVLLKLGFDRPRPDLVAQLAHTQSSSFPSGHAMLAAVTYLTLGVLLARAHGRKRTKIFVMSFAIGLTLLIGMSRVYLGVHWPTDVLAGWALGAAWAALWWLLAWQLQRRGGIEKPVEAGAEG